jgi:hypothetical protein
VCVCVCEFQFVEIMDTDLKKESDKT